MHFGKRNDFDKGQLYLAAASFKHRCIVILSLTVPLVFLNLFTMFRAVTNVRCSTRETIYSFCLAVVARARSDRIQSFQSFDCFHRLIQYFTLITSRLRPPPLRKNQFSSKK